MILLILLVVGAGAAPAAAQDYALDGPLRERDMTPLHLTRLEMMPAEASAAIGQGWTIEVDETHTNTFAKSARVGEYLIARNVRAPITLADATALLATPGNFMLLDGEFGLVATTVRYRSSERLSLFVTLPYYYYTGGIFDGIIEAYHRDLGLGQELRPFVTRNGFAVVYRVGREEVVEIGSPPSGLSDPIVGARYRLLPAASRWDLIVETAVKAAMRGQGSLSTGGSDVAVQMALHRFFERSGVYLDVSAVHLGGPYPDGRFDRQTVPAYTAGYEFGVTHRTSAVLQLYISPSVFTHTGVIELDQTKFEVIGGLRTQRGPLTWDFDIIENLVHGDNTPDIGAQIGASWKLGGR
jgi:Protein of unknown function (DUF3187)